jgi:hypothetical protein
MLKKLLNFAAVIGCLLVLNGCKNQEQNQGSSANQLVTWKEEVQLNDGRVVVVDQRKKMGGLIAREAWLTINLPEFSASPIVWHENLSPLVLNVDDGRLYVVGFPPTKIETKIYGYPRPNYVAYVWENGAWSRIPFEKIPQAVYETNLLIEDAPSKGMIYLDLKTKNGPNLNGDPREPSPMKRLSPKFFAHS